MFPYVGADQILEVVDTRGLIASPRIVEVSGNREVEGELVLADGTIHTVRLPGFIPLNLPRVRLASSTHPELCPHVTEESGTICYLDAEGLVLDSNRPGEIIAEALRRVALTLQVNTSEQRGAEFVDEFEVYWRNLPNQEVVFNVADPSSRPGWRIVIEAKDKPTYLANGPDEVSAYYSGRIQVNERTVRRAPYFPLAKGSVIIPPSRKSGIWSATDARTALLQCMSPDDANNMAKILKKRSKNVEYCFFDLPRPNGGSSMFGLKFTAPGPLHPLLDGGTAQSVTPVVVHRRDRSYLLPRGGANASLADFRVLVVGCGAIGGHVALELARAGVVRQSLVDPDFLAAENAFRHALGNLYAGENKAKALAKEMSLQLPYMDAEGIDEDIVVTLASGRVQLETFDLVVAATGKPTIEMFIDGKLHLLERRPRAVYTWVEPLGIGGHVVLTGSPNGRGCLRCLFTAPVEGLPDLHNRLAFAEQGKSYGRALSGCGSLHSPFGSLDALRTAQVTVDLCLKVLQRQTSENFAISWRGDAGDFRRQGHKTTPRYELRPEKIQLHESDFQSPRCPVCCGANSV